FFQAEDGIRDFHVTGVQTCALPISSRDFGIPVEHARKEAEEDTRCHHVMEMADDVIRIVQMVIREVEGEWQTGKSADTEHRNERDRKSVGQGKSVELE